MNTKPSMNAAVRQQYLDAMGIAAWVRRALPEAEDAVRPMLAAKPDVAIADAQAPRTRHACADVAGMDWSALQAAVSGCEQCELCVTRTQTVFGVGDRQADWLVIGEAPGADEDRQGEPFVGRAGQLLNAMLSAIGRKREQVYIANILKCRPPNNRDPLPAEVASCEGYLRRQIALIKPKLILAVGRIAAQNLLKCDTSIGKLRGMVHTLPGTDIPLVVVYHPAYLLRSPGEKRLAWEDLLLARRITRSASA